MKQFFLVKPVKLENMNEKSFAPQNVPHTVKLSFSDVLKHFSWQLKKYLLNVLKVTISEKS